MPEEIPTSPENKKKPSEISKKTRKLIQAFSLSAWIALGWVSYADDTTTDSLEVDSINTQNQIWKNKNEVYNELKYLFTEKQDWFMQSILQKAKDEWSYYDNLPSDLEYLENYLIITFEAAIKKNGLELEYFLEPELIDLMSSMKSTFNILLSMRYWDWKYDIFDGKDYSKYTLKITFKKVDNWYKIESLYIISPENPKKEENTTQNIYRTIV